MKFQRIGPWRKARSLQQGFTLIEVMIVILIIGLIAGAVGFGVVPKMKKAKIETAKMLVGKISQAASMSLSAPGGTCPKGIDDLVAQGDLTKSQAKDPWGTPFIFRCPGTKEPDGVDVASAGPDKKPGTEDDINSWDIQ